MRITLNDCLTELQAMEENSVDSIVTDPPYGLSFMNKQWDYDVPSVEIWKECLRVLNPGGHLLSFASSRTYHRMAINIEDAGFEIRDQIMWVYGSGFPKSHNLKGEYTGWGTALKPAHEPIVMARKSLEGTVAENVLEYGTGAINIDASRISYNGEIPNIGGRAKHGRGDGYGFKPLEDKIEANVNGRWPANIMFDEEAAKILDKQSENVSRFFYIPKANKKERGDGNIHPTVKPIALMEYLIKLITPEKGIVLDPFMGSGTTGIAAVGNDFDFIGIEREKEYYKIAKARIKSESLKRKFF